MIWLKIFGPIVLIGLLWAGVHNYGHGRFKAGKAEIQAKWDQDEAEEKRVADAATAQAKAQDEADAARNKEIEDAHAKELAAIAADRDRTFRLLRAARATADTIRASQGAGVGGVAEASAPGSPDEAGSALDAAIADVVAEARANASQLDALIAEIKPQL